MVSKVSICNQSLAHCQAASLISNFDSDTGKEADLLRRFYDTALLECLEAAPWSFARDETSLAAVSGESSVLWDYCYGLPSNFVAVRYLVNDSDPANPPAWEIGLQSDGTTRMLMTDEYQAVLVFTKLVTTTTLYSGLFIAALSLNLAQYICGPLTDDYVRQERLMERYLRTIGRAVSLDSTQRNATEAERQPSSTWHGAR